MKTNTVKRITKLFDANLGILRISTLIFGIIASENLSAQGGTHPGFDPDFGLFASIDNKVLLAILIAVSLFVYFILKRKKKEH